MSLYVILLRASHAKPKLHFIVVIHNKYRQLPNRVLDRLFIQQNQLWKVNQTFSHSPCYTTGQSAFFFFTSLFCHLDFFVLRQHATEQLWRYRGTWFCVQPLRLHRHSSLSPNTELKRSPFKAWSRSVYSHTCYTYCQWFPPRLFLPIWSIHLHFFQNLSRFFHVLAVANAGSYVGPQKKKG